MSHGLIPNSKYLPNHPTEYEAYFSAHLLHELFLFSFIWYFCVGSEKVQSRVRLLCLLYKTILPWGMARRKLKGWGSLANSFIPLPLISAFCIKKQREEEEEQRSIQSSHSQGLRTVDLTWIMIPFSLYSACSALENVHTKAWSKKEKHLRTWFSVRANSLRFQRTPQGAYLLHLKMQQFVLMGVRTSFLGLGRAPAMRRNISFVISTYLGPLIIDTLPGGSSALSRAPTVPKIYG